MVIRPGFAVLTAANGQEGLDRARAQCPDPITPDISMPEESGVRMFLDLQSDPEASAIPVIVITGISHDFKHFIETHRHLRPPPRTSTYHPTGTSSWHGSAKFSVKEARRNVPGWL